MTNFAAVIANALTIMIILLQCARFAKTANIGMTEGTLTHAYFLQMLAETLFYIVALLAIGFWRPDVGYNCPNIAVAFILLVALILNIRRVFFGQDIDFAVLFANDALSASELQGVKNAIVTISFLLHIGFFLLLWSGGLFFI